MLPTKDGAIRLFQFRGIHVFLHWSWFLVAAVELQYRSKMYSSLAWNAVEYLSLFLIVLLHEFGHSLACRSVGGYADQIVLWPLGGVAYVMPPERPGAQLWSIAAGPLVNVVLLCILMPLEMVLGNTDIPFTHPDSWRLLEAVSSINKGLLIFNVLPIYPLDGGQILRSLLWFGIGRTKSLLVATAIGLVGAIVIGIIGAMSGSIWILIVAAFILMNCWRGWQYARALRAQERLI